MQPIIPPVDIKAIANVDQSWIDKSQIVMKSDSIVCCICYQIIFNPVQCLNCHKLICKSDSDSIKRISNSCPMCKAKPWRQQKSIHTMYNFIYDNIKFSCQLCDQKKLGIKQLKNHLQNEHKLMIRGYDSIVAYSIKTQDNQIIEFPLYFNLQIHHNIKKGEKGSMTIKHGKKSYQINFATMSVVNNQKQMCQLKVTKVLPKESQYIAWSFANDTNDQQFYDNDIQDYIQKQYQIYLKNNKFNEIIIEVQNIARYRINFKKMLQINTYSQFQRELKRLIITN